MERQHPQPLWSAEVHEADWIAERLAPFASGVSSVVPDGFEAYARVLHPAEEAGRGTRLVRWAQVSAWSGLPLRPDTQFHGVALPAERPGEPAPWRSQGPSEGRLYLPDAEALCEQLRRFTTTPEECFFCLWDGYAFGGVPLTAQGAPPAAPLPDPVPSAVRSGPVVALPQREYLLYTGPVEAITAPTGLDRGQTANLAWPADRAWCVASEIDLTSSYVGGPSALVERLLDDGRIEALPASPSESINKVEPLVATLVHAATDELLDGGHAVIASSRGRVEAWLERPSRWRQGALRTHSERDDGTTAGSRGPVRRREDLRQEAVLRLTGAVLGLVEA
ncbi:MAG: hypothetical protein ACRDYD_01475 [Acidimicrobiales bacterium]